MGEDGAREERRMLPASLPTRSGIFISHAHEDGELAQAVNELLKSALGVGVSEITCTSDDEFGLQRGEALDDQIRSRLDSAQALFLLATPAARHKDWVQYECAYADQASTRGDMHFYVLTPIPSHANSVPAPYRERIAVTMSRGTDLHTFVQQLRRTFAHSPGPGDKDYVSTLLRVHARCVGMELDELQQQNRQLDNDRRVLDENCVRLEKQIGRFRIQRWWSQAAAILIVVALIAISLLQRRDHDATIETLQAAHKEELDRRDAEANERTLEIERQRDAEFRSFPLSGLFQDGQDRLIPCVRVTAHVVEANGQERSVEKDCRQGRFTFGGSELGVDPRERFKLTVAVRDDTHEVLVDRPTALVALPIRGINP
jgi:hypothetical protein